MEEKALLCLFTTIKEMKRSFENPVIFLSSKDFAVEIFISLANIQTALLKKESVDKILDIVKMFHIDWLKAVQDVEIFKKRYKDTPREIILQSVDFTKERVTKRYKRIVKYIEEIEITMDDHKKELMVTEIEDINDMHAIIQSSLSEKQNYLLNTVDKIDFLIIVYNEIEELLNWLDRIYGYLCVMLCKVLDLEDPLLDILSKSLHEMIDKVTSASHTSNGPTAELTNASRDSLDITNIDQKIKNLQDRIATMNDEKTAGSDEYSADNMAVQHKTIYLKDRLESLDDLKSSLKFLESQRACLREDDKPKDPEGHNQIFNHLLPNKERCQLVDILIRQWQAALFNNRDRSFISILNSTDMNEVFSDELGTFTVDKHGRKIYTKDNDEILYQQNDSFHLVPVMDDNEHVYFYDEIGRYFLNENRVRVYKAHSNTSEYLLHKSGMLIKVSEIEDGIKYHYNNLGRYYIDENGDKIYRNKDSEEKYYSDGFGNLLRIRDNDQLYETCPNEPIETEASLYLKNSIGTALKICLAKTVMVQPPDPVNYLAELLIKYRCDLEATQNYKEKEEKLMAERKLLAESHKPAVTPCSSATYEQDSDKDYNFENYYTDVVKTIGLQQ